MQPIQHRYREIKTPQREPRPLTPPPYVWDAGCVFCRAKTHIPPAGLVYALRCQTCGQAAVMHNWVHPHRQVRYGCEQMAWPKRNRS